MDASRAEALKEEGNAAFAKGKLQAATVLYSEAILFGPRVSTYYTNRAMCHKRQADWQNCALDCSSALEIDETSIKGHYLMGVALDAGHDFAEAITHLTKALDLCKGRTVSYKDEIQKATLSCRQRQWAASRPAADAQLRGAQALVDRLLREHVQREREALTADAAATQVDGPVRTMGSAAHIEVEHEAQLARECVKEALGRLRAARGPGKVPDHLCCQITMEIMLEPHTTPDGISYEKAALLEHLQKVWASSTQPACLVLSPCPADTQRPTHRWAASTQSRGGRWSARSACRIWRCATRRGSSWRSTRGATRARRRFPVYSAPGGRTLRG